MTTLAVRKRRRITSEEFTDTAREEPEELKHASVRDEISREIHREVAPCMVQLHLLAKEIFQGREEYLDLFRSQQEINKQEIRNSILQERCELERICSSMNSDTRVFRQTNEFLGLLNDQ